MVRIKDRNKQIPGGLKFLQPETQWKPYPFSSFDTIVRQLITHRAGNPYLKQKNNWSVDYESVAAEVDAYNAKICQEMGWNDYIMDDAAPLPKGVTPHGRASVVGRAGAVVGKLAAGAATLAAWLGPGGKPVDPTLSQARADVCLNCPKNGQGGLLAYFTKKASNLVQKQMEERSNMKLATTVDEKLGVCTACECPIKLKVHTPLEYILARIPESATKELDPRCWILSEQNK